MPGFPPSGRESGKSPLGVMGGGASPSPHTVLTIPPDSGIHPLLFSRLWGPLEGMSRISHLPAGAAGLCVRGSWTSVTPRVKQVQACAGEELGDPTGGFSG